MARLEMSVLEASDIATAGGTPDALFELGLMYCAGREVELDLVSAHKWFNLAAMRGNDDAKRYRMEIAHEMSKAQIAEAQRQAREWLARHWAWGERGSDPPRMRYPRLTNFQRDPQSHAVSGTH